LSPKNLEDQSKGERAKGLFLKEVDHILDWVLLRIEPESLEDAPDPFEREVILPLTMTENRFESWKLEPATPRVEIKKKHS
jgi:hypothetical protein